MLNSEYLTARAASGWPAELAGASRAAERARALLLDATRTARSVLIVCENGFDTEAIARVLHRAVAAQRFEVVDCGGADAATVERALFGQPAGRRASRVLESATGDGQLLRACGGTLFLRDATALPAAVQSRLARALRDGEVVSGGRRHLLDLRLVACARPGIDLDVVEGRFRDDLYRRIGAVRVDLPPLRLRPDDVGAIAAEMAAEMAAAAGLAAPRFTQAATALLAAMPWRGNVRELRGVVERLLVDAQAGPITIEDALRRIRVDQLATSMAAGATLRDARRQFERDYIASVLAHHGGRMAEAARALGIQRTNLYRKARQLGLARASAGGQL